MPYQDSGIVRTFKIRGYEIEISGLSVRYFIRSSTEFLLSTWLYMELMTEYYLSVPAWVPLVATVWYFFKPYYWMGAFNQLFTVNKSEKEIKK